MTVCPVPVKFRDLLNQTAIGSRRLHAGARIDGEPADVQLVNHGRGPRQAEWLIAAPIEVLVRNDALWRGARVVDVGERQVRPRRRGVVAHGESGIVIRRWNNRPGARVQYQLVRVEAVPEMGRIRSGDAKAIELPRPNPFEAFSNGIVGLSGTPPALTRPIVVSRKTGCSFGAFDDDGSTCPCPLPCHRRGSISVGPDGVTSRRATVRASRGGQSSMDRLQEHGAFGFRRHVLHL